MRTTERIERLEREVQWWRVTTVVLVAIVTAALVIGARPVQPKVPDELRAKRLVLVDDAGRARVELGTLAGVRPKVGLEVKDEAGSIRVRLETTGLAVFDAETHYRVWLGAEEPDVPNLVLFGPTSLAAVVAGDNGSSRVELSRKGGVRALLAVAPDGSPSVQLNDDQQFPVTTLSLLGLNLLQTQQPRMPPLGTSPGR